MVNTGTMTPNGREPLIDAYPGLPEMVTISQGEMQQFPSPGTQRALKAETGRDYLSLGGPDADSADRTQTLVWTYLRRQFPDLRWGDCENVALQLSDGPVSVDPTKPASSEPSLPFAGSGG